VVDKSACEIMWSR